MDRSTLKLRDGSKWKDLDARTVLRLVLNVALPSRRFESFSRDTRSEISDASATRRQ